MKYGKVWLVGAGPGDPGLLTIKGKEIIETADVVLYDALMSSEILNYCNATCEKIYVGKRSGRHSARQEEINEMLLSNAAKYGRVVRLKGGDPFVFGRGGEEALFLRSKGVAFEVVPGVTAGVAVPAYAGIPITHRGTSTSVTFVTGHVSNTTGPKRNWHALANVNGTLVFFMGVHNLKEISEELIKNGRDPATPTAIVRNGTMPTQERLTSTLAEISAKVEAANFLPPALVIVGDVVGLAEELSWLAGDDD